VGVQVEARLLNGNSHRQSDRVAFTVADPRPGLDALAGRWLNASQGASIIWWNI
jgi:hypothetical protein